jgi:hypothetical protein
MASHKSAPVVTGLVTGALVALGFALLIGLLPESLFLQAHWRVVVYVVCAAAAPPTVLFVQWIARIRGLDQRGVFAWAAAGAMTFDGLAIGFAPFLYGQTGQALAWTASALIFAFASLLIAGQIMLGSRAAATVHR